MGRRGRRARCRAERPESRPRHPRPGQCPEGRRPAGQHVRRLQGRRHGHGHDRVREARHRDLRPRVGPGALSPVQQVRLCLSARGHPPVSSERRRGGERSGGLPDDSRQGQTGRRPSVQPADLEPRLHRLRLLRERLSREAGEGARHGPGRILCREFRRLGVRAEALRQGRRLRPLHRQGQPVPAAPPRVLCGLCRLRRDSLRETPHAALRRPRLLGERHRLLPGLGLGHAGHPVHRQPRRPRSRLDELAL